MGGYSGLSIIKELYNLGFWLHFIIISKIIVVSYSFSSEMAASHFYSSFCLRIINTIKSLLFNYIIFIFKFVSSFPYFVWISPFFKKFISFFLNCRSIVLIFNFILAASINLVFCMNLFFSHRSKVFYLDCHFILYVRSYWFELKFIHPRG